MKHRKVYNKWIACQFCHQLCRQHDDHVCPPEACAKKEAELDMLIEEEMKTWEFDQKVFWKSKDVRFAQHLLDKGKYD